MLKLTSRGKCFCVLLEDRIQRGAKTVHKSDGIVASSDEKS